MSFCFRGYCILKKYFVKLIPRKTKSINSYCKLVCIKLLRKNNFRAKFNDTLNNYFNRRKQRITAVSSIGFLRHVDLRAI